MAEVEYRAATRRFVTGIDAFLGNWNVGGVYYDGLRSADDPKRYKVTCALPGLSKTLGNFETQEEAKARLNLAVAHWIKNANLG